MQIRHYIVIKHISVITNLDSNNYSTFVLFLLWQSLLSTNDIFFILGDHSFLDTLSCCGNHCSQPMIFFHIRRPLFSWHPVFIFGSQIYKNWVFHPLLEASLSELWKLLWVFKIFFCFYFLINFHTSILAGNCQPGKKFELVKIHIFSRIGHKSHINF